MERQQLEDEGRKSETIWHHIDHLYFHQRGETRRLSEPLYCHWGEILQRLNPPVTPKGTNLNRLKPLNSAVLCYIITQSIRYSLPQQELVDGLLFPHALHDQTVQVDEQSAAKATGDSADTDKDAVCLLKEELGSIQEKAEPESLTHTGNDLLDPL